MTLFGILSLYGIIAFVSGTEFLRIVTYNAGLTSKVPEYATRRNLVGPALAQLSADVVCLQEVWFSTDMSNVLDHVTNTNYPHSFSALHEAVDQMTTVSSVEAPCRTPSFFSHFLPCLKLTCGSILSNPNEAVQCVERCGLLKLPQQCITCLALSTPSDMIPSCVSHISKYNIPGLLLLSNRPLKNAKIVNYANVDKKLFLPRSYISAEVDGVGTIVCTHTTANAGPQYFEELPYNSWEEQNLAEARTLVSVLQDVPRAIILGDLNSSPGVANANITQDMPAAYRHLSSHGYDPVYMNDLGICTWCTYNPLTHARHNMILDHVMLKGLTAFGAMRIMDDDVDGHAFPLSDHFGIMVAVAIDAN